MPGDTERLKTYGMESRPILFTVALFSANHTFPIESTETDVGLDVAFGRLYSVSPLIGPWWIPTFCEVTGLASRETAGRLFLVCAMMLDTVLDEEQVGIPIRGEIVQ